MTAHLPADVVELLPEEDAPPSQLDPRIFGLALETFLAGRRLDMRALADELGISRSTLYRRVGDRDRLLGAVVWYLARRAFVPILVDTAELHGPERITEAIRRFMHFVHAQPAFQRLLAAEPEAALRVLTSQRGFVQGALIGVTRRAIDQQEREGALRPVIDADTLAYCVIRIAESFLYADTIARNDPNLDEAAALIGRLLAGDGND